jgi:hypothetical protein
MELNIINYQKSKVMKKKFIFFMQNYYPKPMIDFSIGMNENVYVEVKHYPNAFYDDNVEEATYILEELGFDMLEYTILDAHSDDEFPVWSAFNEIFMDDEEIKLLKKSSVIMLDGSIINL